MRIWCRFQKLQLLQLLPQCVFRFWGTSSPEVRARIELKCEEALCCTEVSKCAKGNYKLARLPFSSSSWGQHQTRHQFPSGMVVTFQYKCYAFCTSCARIPALIEAPKVSICPKCKRAFICAKCRTSLWGLEFCIFSIFHSHITNKIGTFLWLVIGCFCFSRNNALLVHSASLSFKWKWHLIWFLHFPKFLGNILRYSVQMFSGFLDSLESHIFHSAHRKV